MLIIDLNFSDDKGEPQEHCYCCWIKNLNNLRYNTQLPQPMKLYYILISYLNLTF